MVKIIFIGCFNLRLIILLLSIILLDIVDATSIFKIMLGNQPAICNSLIKSNITSRNGPGVKHPIEINDLNYEYTISTPNFPSSYPTNIQCITLIKAPNFDYQILLQIRQKFDVEPFKNCARDFLEITDGPYGFSNSIGKFCNTERPPEEIKSSGSFLWLRFRSDNDLPHSGFQIVYRFVRNNNPKPHRQYCFQQTIIPPGESFNFSSSFLKSKLEDYARTQNNYDMPIECVFDFHVNEDFKTYAYTTKFIKYTLPIPCSSNKIDIYHKHTFDKDIQYPHKLNYFKVCQEEDFSKQLLQDSTRTTIRTITMDLAKMDTIIIILTSVKITKDKCPSDYFMCSSKPTLCISKTLTCNNEPNCPDSNDENCTPKGELLNPEVKIELSTTEDSIILRDRIKKAEEAISQRKANKVHGIILGTIGFILIIALIFCLLLTIHSKKKDKINHLESVVDVVSNQEKPQSKNMFYKLLQSSEPSVAALSTDKLNRKIYNHNQIWSKRSLNNISTTEVTKFNNYNSKLSGGINGDIKIISNTNHPFKSKVVTTKSSSLNKIGKYLSVPNPAKNELIINLPFNIISPSEKSWSSNIITKQTSLNNKSAQHIQRASSMSSGLRRKINENVFSKNVEWYCGPVIKDENIRNNSFEMLNANSAKHYKHVPGCQSLPNFCNEAQQNPIYYMKPISPELRHIITDSLDYGVDGNISYTEDKPEFSVANHHQKNIIRKYPEFNRNNYEEPSHYGFKYFCAHNPTSKNNFVEYIA